MGGSDMEAQGWREWGLWREDGCSSLTHSRFPEADMDSMDEPIDPDPVLTVSGGSAIALLVAGCVGLVVVMLGIGSAIVQIQRYRLSPGPWAWTARPTQQQSKAKRLLQGASGSFREDGTEPRGRHLPPPSPPWPQESGEGFDAGLSDANASSIADPP